MREIVLVTEKTFRKAAPILAEAPDVDFRSVSSDEERLATEVASLSVRAVIVGIEKYSGPLYEALACVSAGRGALVARFGVGHDGIDKGLARSRGIIVTNTPGTMTESVAEHSLWLLGDLARHVGSLQAEFRKGHFAPRQGMEIAGKTLVVVGFGAIGRRVARSARFGCGMNVVAVGACSGDELARREGRPLDAILAEHGASHYTNDLDSTLGEADFVSLHLPATATTRHLIDERRLARMKPDARLINTARGALVDEAALYDALIAGRLGGAALDVFENEPYRPIDSTKDLRTLENVVLTPHVGSNTTEANRRMAESCLDTARKFLRGEIGDLPRVG